MAKKRWLGLTLTAALAFGSLSGAALAADVAEPKLAASSAVAVNLDGPAQQKLLETLIPEVREKIGVSETLDQFSSDYWSNTEGGSFYLRWWNDGSGASVAATVTPSGELLNVYKYSNQDNSQRQHFSSLSKDEARQKAKALVKVLAPEVAAQLTDEPEVRYDRYSGYVVGFQRMIDGVPVQNQTLNVSLDSNTGELRGLDRSWQNSLFTVTDAKSGVISADKATQALKDKLGLKLHYRLSYDYSTGVRNPEPKVVLEYVWNNYQSFSIDAKSGALYTPPSYESVVFGGKGGDGRVMNYAMADAEAATPQALTPEEQKVVESLKDLITSEAALSKLRAVPNLALDDSFVLSSANYGYNYENKDQILISLQLTSGTEKDQKAAYAQLDAKTGELISFSMNQYTVYPAYGLKATEPTVKRATAQATAEAFLKQVKPELWKQVKLVEAESPFAPMYRYSTTHDFRYERQVEGLPFEQNGLYVNVDFETGKINSFSQSWNTKLTFPAKATAISLNKAYDALFAVEKPALYYISVYHEGTAQQPTDAQVVLSYNAKLVYSANKLPALSINAVSGAVQQYDTVYKEQTVSFVYPDLKDHKDASKIQAVAEQLQFAAMDEFRPEAQITQVEWLRWLSNLNYAWTEENDDSFYRSMIMNGVITEAERDPDAVLTALDGAKFLVRSLGMGQYAKLRQPVFVNPFDLDTEQAAYVALAAGTKAIDLKTFRPAEALTRYDAVMILFSYLSR